MVRNTFYQKCIRRLHEIKIYRSGSFSETVYRRNISADILNRNTKNGICYSTSDKFSTCDFMSFENELKIGIINFE